MPDRETGSGASLQYVRSVRLENGPPLSVGEYVCEFLQLQVLHLVPGLCAGVLHLRVDDVVAVFYYVLGGERQQIDVTNMIIIIFVFLYSAFRGNCLTV